MDLYGMRRFVKNHRDKKDRLEMLMAELGIKGMNYDTLRVQQSFPDGSKLDQIMPKIKELEEALENESHVIAEMSGYIQSNFDGRDREVAHMFVIELLSRVEISKKICLIATDSSMGKEERRRLEKKGGKAIERMIMTLNMMTYFNVCNVGTSKI